MNAAEAVLRSRGIRREKLGAERGNHDALGYYERLGWQIAAPLPESFACQRQDGTAVTEKLDQWLPAKEIRSCKDQHVVRRTESHLNRIRIEYPLVACRRNRPDFRKDAVSGPSAGQLDLRRMQRSKHTRPWLMPHDLALDKLNFLLADVRGGLGPYVSVFLLTEANWDQGTIGLVLTISGITGIVLHSPIGALIDAIRAKRGLIIAGVVALSVCALAIAHAPTLPVVFAADVTMAILGAVLARPSRRSHWGWSISTASPPAWGAMRPSTGPAICSSLPLRRLLGACSGSAQSSIWCPSSPSGRFWPCFRSRTMPSITNGRAVGIGHT